MIKRGEVWLASLNPVHGSEQAGTRPVIIFPENTLSKFTITIITIPITSNLRRALLPTCIKISSGEGGLNQESVAVIKSAFLIRLDLLKN